MDSNIVVALIVALIGAGGTIVAAIISNGRWPPSPKPPKDGSELSPPELPVSPTPISPASISQPQTIESSEVPLFLLRGPDGADAKAEFKNGSLVILTDSFVRHTTVSSCPESVLKLRQELLNSGVLIQQQGRISFSRAYATTTPSAAAGIVLGRAANGWIEWKTAQGQTLEGYKQNLAASAHR